MKKYIVEFIGTFFLVLTVGLVVLGDVSMGPFAIGSVLMVMVYAGGHVSGAHYNPAVTVAVFLRGKCPATDLLPYWIAQLVGATVAAFAAMYLVADGVTESARVDVADKLPVALLAEFLFTFALAFVVLNVATAKGTENNSFYGLAIGFTVLTGALAVGGITGGAFNPAVAVGGAFMKIFAWSQLWVYLVANLLGGALAAIVFMTVNEGDED